MQELKDEMDKMKSLAAKDAFAFTSKCASAVYVTKVLKTEETRTVYICQCPAAAQEKMVSSGGAPSSLLRIAWRPSKSSAVTPWSDVHGWSRIEKIATEKMEQE